MDRVKLKLTLPDSVSAKLQGMVSRGIAALEVDENGHLIVTLTDNSVHDLGKVSGEDGKDGQDGVSVTHEWDGTVLRVTSASGTSEADLKGRDGRDGRDGIDGKDGYTPIKGVDYFDGRDGVDGVDGKDGYTPVKGKDYFDGANGKDGVSATHTWNGTVLTMTSASGTSSADLKGERGEPGAGLSISGSVSTYADLPNDLTLADAGEAYFVEADGKLYIWSGTAWPANGEGSQFKGDKGDPGKDGYTPVKGVDYFDGEDGYTPVKGKDYFDGKDGTSATHRWNGTVLEITSASGTSSADLKGATGDAGYTPQKGVDYFDGKDGEDGYTPQKGVDYFDGVDGKDGAPGKDGVSVTHSWNGTTLTVTSASGTSSADLKGEKGDTGELDYSRLDGYLSKAVYDPQGKSQDVFKYVDDAIPKVPTNVSAFTNDAGYITGYTETDPTVPAWAKASSKPSYTASEVGAAPSSHVSDTTVHITADERTAWNGKATMEQVDEAIGSHNTNTAAHDDIRKAVSAAETAASNAQTTADSAVTAASNANTAAATAQATANSKAPAYTYGTADLTAGSSALTTGTLYFVYE